MRIKFFLSSLVFTLILALSLESVSAEGGHSGPGQHRDMTVLFPPHKGDHSHIQRPAKPELAAPTFMAEVQPDVTLEWKSVEGADRYHVQVATDANFKWLVVNDTFVSGTTLKPAGLASGNKYYWRVFAYKTQNQEGSTKSLANFSAFTVK